MNCKPIKDESCEECIERRLCRTYLGLKELDEYSDEEKIVTGKVDWDNQTPIIAVAKKHPLFGVQAETNVNWSSIPYDIKESINGWKMNLKFKYDGQKYTKTFE